MKRAQKRAAQKAQPPPPPAQVVRRVAKAEPVRAWLTLSCGHQRLGSVRTESKKARCLECENAEKYGSEARMRDALQAAVPLWVQRFRDEKRTLDEVIAIGRECGDTVAQKGDVLQFGGKGCAEAFNALAQGLAASSFVPGGVTFLGLHWESKPQWLKAS
jgi:hypothetical protein